MFDWVAAEGTLHRISKKQVVQFLNGVALELITRYPTAKLLAGARIDRLRNFVVVT
jgi:hypothetical protein